jgi:hypothetical protein
MGPTYMDLLLSSKGLAGDIDEFVDTWCYRPRYLNI